VVSVSIFLSRVSARRVARSAARWAAEREASSSAMRVVAELLDSEAVSRAWERLALRSESSCVAAEAADEACWRSFSKAVMRSACSVDVLVAVESWVRRFEISSSREDMVSDLEASSAE